MFILWLGKAVRNIQPLPAELCSVPNFSGLHNQDRVVGENVMVDRKALLLDLRTGCWHRQAAETPTEA